MSFARRLFACVVAVLAMSVLAALMWDNSDQVAPQAGTAQAGPDTPR